MTYGSGKVRCVGYLCTATIQDITEHMGVILYIARLWLELKIEVTDPQNSHSSRMCSNYRKLQTVALMLIMGTEMSPVYVPSVLLAACVRLLLKHL